jgi:hypothetical protein
MARLMSNILEKGNSRGRFVGRAFVLNIQPFNVFGS